MKTPIHLSKSDVRRAMIRHHFALSDGLPDAFRRLRSVQFDPIAPVGCNHDLVLQARMPDYRIGDWQEYAYRDRRVYDGWDKCASLIPFEGWPVRRYFHAVHRKWFETKIFGDHKDAVDVILREIAERGPLMPKDFDFQARREEWKGSWFGPSVTKQTLRALWHSGMIMTADRKNGQHLYDLAERVVPPELFSAPAVEPADAIRELVLERHRAMGVVRPSAPPEVWSYDALHAHRKLAMAELVASGEIIPVIVDGIAAHATPDFLASLGEPELEARALFIAPLDPFMWDRKMIAHLFGFEYIWEIYTPLAKRKWGYYVLPILYGDALVARAEFWCRDGVLEVREWHFEVGAVDHRFGDALEQSLTSFMRYCSATRCTARDHVPPDIRDAIGAMTIS